MPTSANLRRMSRRGETLVSGLKAHVAASIPAAVAEILLPALRLRMAPGRMVATLPNPIWHEVFQTYAAEPARE